MERKIQGHIFPFKNPFTSLSEIKAVFTVFLRLFLKFKNVVDLLKANI